MTVFAPVSTGGFTGNPRFPARFSVAGGVTPSPVSSGPHLVPYGTLLPVIHLKRGILFLYDSRNLKLHVPLSPIPTTY